MQDSSACENQRWIVALTGASGMCYALRLLELLSERVAELHVVVSEAACRVLQEEHAISISARSVDAQQLLGGSYPNIFFYDFSDIGARIASGSAAIDGMLIVPCSMATLAAVANGVQQNLIHRAADVTLKEGRRLVVVPRETPLSAIHLENMLSLSRLGVSVVPAMPGFYHRPAAIEDLVDMLAMKILDVMRIPNDLVTRWEGTIDTPRQFCTVRSFDRDK